MKKPILMFALSLIAGAALASCEASRIPDLSANPESEVVSSEESIPAEEAAPKEEITPSQVFNMQAVTGLAMANPVASSAINALNAYSEFGEEDIAIIQEALPTVDLVLDNESHFASVVKIVNLDVDGTTYKYEESIRYLTGDFQEASYRLLYNIEGEEEEIPEESEEIVESSAETEVSEETQDEEVLSSEDSLPSKGSERHSDEKEESHHDEHEHEEDKHERDEDKIKSTSTLIGIAYLDEETYVPFYSRVESEVEEDESETEREFVLQTGERSRITIQEEHEIEEDEEEHELSYSITENGRLKTFYKLDIEQKEKKDEITLKTKKQSYRVERVSNDDGVFYRVSVKGHGEKLAATFQKETDEEGNVSYNVI